MKGEKYDTIISFLEGRSLVYHSFILKQGIRHLSWVHVDLFNFHWTKRYFKSNKHEKKCYELMDDVIFVSNDSITLHCLYTIFTLLITKTTI